MMRPLLMLGLLALSACKGEAPPPPAVSMTDEAIGYYCQMNLAEHPGPKAQIHLDGLLAPIFFSQVRDAIAYLRMPEQDYKITAIYVSDMGAAVDWDNPGVDNWITAQDAYFVMDTDRFGGMGAPEAVPFGALDAATAFAQSANGTIMRLDDIPDAAVLAPVSTAQDPATGAEDDGYAERLKALADSRKN